MRKTHGRNTKKSTNERKAREEALFKLPNTVSSPCAKLVHDPKRSYRLEAFSANQAVAFRARFPAEIEETCILRPMAIRDPYACRIRRSDLADGGERVPVR